MKWNLLFFVSRHRASLHTGKHVRVVEVYGLVRDFELLRVHMLARESILVQIRIQPLSHLTVISPFFFFLA